MQDEKLIRTEKDKILRRLRESGMRVTRQRELILDVVLEQECTSCKEIYYRASKKDKNIGIATVYRMVNVLSELGVFGDNFPYRLDCGLKDQRKGCRIILKDRSEVELNGEEWNRILEEAVCQKGYGGTPEIDCVILK